MKHSDGGVPAPFPWFGGKRRVAGIVWERFGDVHHYIEPFFGSGAVLLNRPAHHTRRLATVNDIDGFVSNFWRSVSKDPDAVAHHADWPVNEIDLQARALHMKSLRAPLEALLRGDPDYYDAKIAGWWVWGGCTAIGDSLYKNGPWVSVDGVFQKGAADRGVSRTMPQIGTSGRGVNRKLPNLGDERLDFIRGWFSSLKGVLRETRVLSGDWSRVVGSNSALFPIKSGVSAVFFDPPYKTKTRDTVYAHDSTAIDLMPWLIEHQNNPKLRIAVCGYEGEYDLAGWECVRWKAHGGYSNINKKRKILNKELERIWFSPSCLKVERHELL